jgi:hypothetical protein
MSRYNLVVVVLIQLPPVSQRSFGLVLRVEGLRWLLLKRRILHLCFLVNVVLNLLGEILQFVDSGLDQPFLHDLLLKIITINNEQQ